MNISLDKAISLIKEHTNPIKEYINISLENAKGYILAKDVCATINQPPFDRSPLDGYALRSEDTKGACKENPVVLQVVEEVVAGYTPSINGQAGCATRIMTGAPIPKGYDCVIRQEDTDYGMDAVEIYKSLKEHQNFCFKGEDIEKGSVLIEEGTKLNAIHIGILASQGIQSVEVIKRAKILLVTTGDELITLEDEMQKGKIYNTNLYTLTERLKDFNVDIKAISVGDNHIELSEKINELSKSYDLIITTGGVSVGKKDILHDTLVELNIEPVFWKVDIKPGTPAMFSVYKDTPILSLSGNPFATLATFELLARPLISKLSSDKSINYKRLKAPMKNCFNKRSDKRRFIRATYIDNVVYLPASNHSSGSLSSASECNALIDIPQGNEGLKTGELVDIVLL